MQKNLSIAGIGALFFILVFSFQNCSVYQSSGRKYLEEVGVSGNGSSSLNSEEEENSNSNQSIAKVDEDSCQQYLSTNLVDQWSGGVAVVRSFADLEKVGMRCMYSITDTKNKIDHISCSISSEHVGAANFPSADENELHESSKGKVTSYNSEDELCLNLSPKVGLTGAKCCFHGTTDSADIEAKSLDLALEIIEKLR